MSAVDDRAEDHRARDVGEVLEEPRAWLGRHRHQPLESGQHRAPVLQEEEQHEEHHEEADQGAEHAERQVASHGRGGLEQSLDAVAEPALDLIGADGGVVARPRHRGADEWQRREALENLGPGEHRAALEIIDEMRDLRGEGDAERRERRQHEERREPGEDAGGERAPALEAGAQPLVQRIENEGEHRRPAELGAQRRQDPVERVAEQGHGGHQEAAAVELRLHADLVAPTGAGRKPSRKRGAAR